jgi:hypothetical protein
MSNGGISCARTWIPASKAGLPEHLLLDDVDCDVRSQPRTSNKLTLAAGLIAQRGHWILWMPPYLANKPWITMGLS